MLTLHPVLFLEAHAAPTPNRRRLRTAHSACAATFSAFFSILATPNLKAKKPFKLHEEYERKATRK